ncbi:peptide MFS transporter [Geothrix sp. PMB-07]|uniref:peptide MFS transporter n=1 Tax=Geothrix sp. PMB-07 TaxID=3068640 RepID=UPI0027416729|nr:peptide MFS transporter [Geothrix sp. PMB-07]WLT30962.1 peptide MFS transporter [Geothrix sp. PMB-07]
MSPDTHRHPAGLSTLFLTEVWERLGFYILMAVLTLHMDKEMGWSDGTKGMVYGLFLAGCYFFPLLGGWLGDRLLGQVTTVRLGAALMTLGYIALGLSSRNQVALFAIGLCLIALGTGILKVNVSVLVGNLYADRLHLRDAGFNIYYMGVNIGAAAAPIAATALGFRFGSYRASFWVGAVGMILAQVVFYRGRARLIETDNPAAMESDTARAMLPRESRQRVLVLLGLFVVAALFWTGFYQNGFAMTLFAERSTRAVPLMRPETYQFFQPAFILVLTPVLLGLFTLLRARHAEPSTPRKILLGMLVMGLAMLVMSWASYRGGNLDRPLMSPIWLIGAYGIITAAEILISPLGQSFVTKVAPPNLRGRMMGGWFAATATGGYASGLIGSFYGRMPHHQYYLFLVGLLVCSALLVLIQLSRLERYAV